MAEVSQSESPEIITFRHAGLAYVRAAVVAPTRTRFDDNDRPALGQTTIRAFPGRHRSTAAACPRAIARRFISLQVRHRK
ncbi:hypothetical protein [Lysobacter sp. ISL-54]|uniref:hypothetical protein n=1 Tax=Lysobacter sp. ISL-54 TaxID=2819155 RepID=UPI002035165C|nr:hypothetical protein [Lysobacter sp. ISL-54]